MVADFAEAPASSASRATRLAGRAAAVLVAEQDRWILWLPVGLGLGVALYFLRSTEPPVWVGAAAVAGAAGLLTGLRRRPLLLRIGIAIATVVAGFAAAELRANIVAGPMIDHRIGPGLVSGVVIEAAPLPEGGVRLLLASPDIQGLSQAATPRRVRVRVAAANMDLEPGTRVTLTAVLLPPPPPAEPGAYDFQRQAWFAGLGAVGYGLGEVRGEEIVVEGMGGWWRQGWRRLRHGVTRRILEALPGPEGAVATALITGHQGAIPETTLAAMRDSGLAHLLSISGLHVGLVAATLMVGLRGLLALVPPLALRFPIKKWAAAVALIGTGGYTLLAGAPVPTQRAFVMSAIALLAIMFDRSPLSMRLVAWAAIAVLLAAPESLLSPSFQMSFAAVTALIAAHEGTTRRRAAWRAEGGRLRKLAAGLLAVAATSLVAGLATAPFAIHHFGRLADYGVLANMAAVPITGFWVMPAAGIALAAMPFGLEFWPLAAMAAGIGLIIDIAEGVAALPGAALLVPASPPSALAATAIGGLWLCLWRGRWRWLGLLGPAVAVALALVHRPPDLLIAGDGGVVAVRDGSGRLMLSDPAKGGIAVDTWLRRAGQEEREPIEDELGFMACGAAACAIESGERWVAVVRDSRALAQHCAGADLVIDLVPGRHRRCRGPRLVIDRGDLRREGTHALRIDAHGVRIATVRRDRGERPWVVEAGSPPGRTPSLLFWNEIPSRDR